MYVKYFLIIIDFRNSDYYIRANIIFKRTIGMISNEKKKKKIERFIARSRILS